ncbi:ABC transporter ATP-binding protein/permease [Blautia coccoides]|uniref:ABC transporter ATP-binding protein n=1 Tax=Blautia producta TaxID=33035 RepID=UPI00214A4D4F|nr:ABC transporter ATP-binding protein [Blautia coccoides]MCR1985093.1 ABC transporter ATP-binding protein/permease [Blautia coccoides]
MKRENYKNALAFYGKLLKKYRLNISIAFFLSVLKICISLLLPIISMRILDSAIPGHDLKEVMILAVCILTFTICQSLINYILEAIYAKIGKSVYLDYQQRVITHFTNLSGEYYSNMKFGEAYNTIYEDIERVQGLVSGNIFQFVIDAISSIGVLIILFFMQWDLAMLLVILLPIIYFCQRYFQSKGRKMASVLREKDGELIGILEDIISNIIPFHYSRCKDFFVKKYNCYVNNSKDSEISLQLLSVKNRGILNFLAQLFSIVVIGYGGIKVISGNLTVGGLIAFNMYGNQMVSPILNISGVLMNLQTNLISLDRVHQFLELQSIDLNSEGLALKEIKEIEFSNMDFSYNENSILDKFNAKFYADKITMLVGESGSGKSTILSILYRLWNSKAGNLLINSIDINKFSVESLREQITIVSQDMYLFNDTIRNNLVMNQQKSDEEVINAIEIACFAQVLQQLPEGLDTIIGENGIRFSGGERQRICLARALLRNTPVLILDEATSALDQVTEERVLKNIKKNIKGKIIVMITHRMENCKSADNIIVLKNGTDVASGNHETLLKNNQYYRNLFERSYVV